MGVKSISAVNGNFGQRLRQVREARGWSQTRLADECGATLSSVSAWERGQTEPGLESVRRISAALNVSAHWLLVGEGPRRLPEALALADTDGNVSAVRVLMALVTRVFYERDFWKMTAPLMAQTKNPMMGERERAGVNAVIARMADESGIDLEAGPPDEAMLKFAADAERIARAAAKASLKVRSGPIQRDGYVEEVIRDFEPAPKPGGSARSKKKRGA